MANVLSSGLQGFGGTFGTGLSFQGQPVNSPFGGFFNGLGDAFGLGGWGSGAANVGSGWGNSGSQGGIGGAGGFSGGDAGYGSDARSGRDGADQGNN
jgi:host factor-I protein